MGGILRRRLVLGNAVGQAITKTFISVCFQFPHRGNSLQNIFNAKFKIFLFKAAFQLRACLLIRGRRIEYTLIYLSTYFSAEKDPDLHFAIFPQNSFTHRAQVLQTLAVLSSC